jgi:membrane-associated protease RseP (regulator of RpoE activity)
VTWVGVLAAAVAILTSVLLHEAGHFVTAKHYGMKATRFFVGFGPTIWSRQRGETEYGVKAFPVGGFVKIVGMTPLEEVEPGDEDRVFYKQRPGPRAVVLAAGSIVHFILAIVITYLVLVLAGDLTSPQQRLSIAQVPNCVYTSTTQSSCPPGAPASPSLGHLQPGDLVVSADGVRVTSEATLTSQIDSHVGVPVDLGVRRHGRLVHVAVVPVKSGSKARIGVILQTSPVVPHVGALAAVPRTFAVVGTYLDDTGRGLAALPSTVAGVIEGKPRNPNGPVSVVGAARAGGQLFAYKGLALHEKLGAFFLLMASLNFFIGLFNLLPLLPLDGGHLAILGFEQARSRLYRMIGRRDPGRVDLNRIMPVTYAVVVIFIGLSVVLLYADLFHPLNLNG